MHTNCSLLSRAALTVASLVCDHGWDLSLPICPRSVGGAGGRTHSFAEAPPTLQPAAAGRHNGCLPGGEQASACTRAANM